MAFSFQQIRYGWVALVGVVLTGTTIYVLNNTREHVQQIDVIEIALGVTERCLATQITTNPTYGVNPPAFVSEWLKPGVVAPYHDGDWGYITRLICYTSYWPSTSGVSIVVSYTNRGAQTINYAQSWTATGGHVWVTLANYGTLINVTDSYETVTNAIGWHIDRDMMVSLDATIKALVPYYVDTNTVYDGTTNIVMLTVTGLWASLQIGDKTNQFTRTPCWTNPISTNWIVNYTSYWPSTNGTATNINYTSDYRQVVNYAQSWTATGGHIWVTSSNWESRVGQTTNAATYGDYPWQIYAEDLQERYKVLNALKMTRGGVIYNYRTDGGDATVNVTNGWTTAKTITESAYTVTYTGFLDSGSSSGWEWFIGSDDYLDVQGNATNYVCQLGNLAIIEEPVFYCTNISLLDTGHYIHGVTNSPYIVFDDNGLGVEFDKWKKVTFPFGLNEGVIPSWSIEPTNSTHQYRGVVWAYQAYPTWQFSYCTNKYW
jgi:hypothetical protein